MAQQEQSYIGTMWGWGKALWRWACVSPRRICFLARIGCRFGLAYLRRRRQSRRIDGPIPIVIAVSPTMRCNYSCAGCYSRARHIGPELSNEDLDALFHEAETLGVAAVVVTGGEPLLRKDITRLIAKHRRLLFVVITNGSMLTSEIAGEISRCGNVITLVSVEGFVDDTDERRRPGAYGAAVQAFDNLRKADACFGFAATNNAANSEHLGSDEFVDEMVALGCAVGFYSEYVPCGPDPRPAWVLDAASRAAFRARVLDLQRRKPILLSQFPDDEYGPENRCAGAGRLSLHINAQGDVEPCPFVPVAVENIRRGGLVAACESPFLRSIRERSNLLQRKHYACSLFENLKELEVVAEQSGAQWNERRRQLDSGPDE